MTSRTARTRKKQHSTRTQLQLAHQTTPNKTPNLLTCSLTHSLSVVVRAVHTHNTPQQETPTSARCSCFSRALCCVPPQGRLSLFLRSSSCPSRQIHVTACALPFSLSDDGLVFFCRRVCATHEDKTVPSWTFDVLGLRLLPSEASGLNSDRESRRNSDFGGHSLSRPRCCIAMVQ